MEETARFSIERDPSIKDGIEVERRSGRDYVIRVGEGVDLEKDSKVTTKQLSLELNLSVTAVYERIKKLERVGVIEKYVAVINKEKIDKSDFF